MDRDERFVEALYVDLLGRPSDPGGKAAWVAAVRRGTPRATVAAAFLDSAEYVGSRVEAEYLRVLRRPADPGGRDAAVRGLQGGSSWESFLSSLLASDEYRAQFPPAEAWIEQLYLDVLGRGSDPGGKAAHVAGLQAGGNDYLAEARSFVDSGERQEQLARAQYARLLGRAPTTQEVAAWGASERAATLRLCAGQEYYDRLR